MSNAHLIIYGMPTRAIAATVGELAGVIDPRIARHGLLLSIGVIRERVSADGSTENPSVVVTMDNKAGQCAALFAVPPVAARAELFAHGALVFSGLVQSLDLDEAAQLSVQA